MSAARGWLLGVLGGALVLLLPGCVAGGGGGVDVSYGADFYEPLGYEYGGWGRGYRVGPPRGRGGEHVGGGRGAPSIAHGARGGGGAHGGGGRPR